jgi:hypothetical protein
MALTALTLLLAVLEGELARISSSRGTPADTSLFFSRVASHQPEPRVLLFLVCGADARPCFRVQIMLRNLESRESGERNLGTGLGKDEMALTALTLLLAVLEGELARISSSRGTPVVCGADARPCFRVQIMLRNLESRESGERNRR